MRFCFCKYGMIVLVMCVTVLPGCSTGYDATIECYSTGKFQKHSLPSFTKYIMNVRSGNDGRIDIYLQIPNRNLRFEKLVDDYKASFSITFIIRDINKEILQTKELERNVIAKTYEETISSRFDVLLQSFILKPSTYILEIVTVDQLSQLRYKETSRIEAKNFTDSTISASTVLLLDTAIVNGQGLSLRPIFPASLSRLNDFFGIFQELYNVRKGDTIKIVESYLKQRKLPDGGNSFVYFTPPYRLKTNGCIEEADSVYFETDSTFVTSKNVLQQLIQFYPLPSSGYNKISRKIIVTRRSRSDTIRLSDNYFIRDKTLQPNPSFREVINIIRYISRESEYDSIAPAIGEEKDQRINRFWENHGGVEHRKEFEQSIREANALFTECSNGAETPMGIVFIICGIPDYIECRGGTIETWFYNVGERSFPIQFRRENESIAYYSMLPFSVNDSLWQYFVDRWRRK